MVAEGIIEKFGVQLKHSKRLPVPAHVFQIGPSGYASPQYVNVAIHASDKNLNAWRKEKDPKAYDVNAFFRPPDKKAQDHDCGELHFSDQEMDIPIVVHEVFHAMMCWARKNKCVASAQVGSGWDFEEVCAEVMEKMVNQIVKEMIHRGYVINVARKY